MGKTNQDNDQQEIELQPLLANPAANDPDDHKQKKEAADKVLKHATEIRTQLTWLLRFGAFVRNILVLAGEAAVIIAKVIPPIRALVNGAHAIVELSIIAYNKVIHQVQLTKTHAVRIATSISTMGLAAAAAILALNPLTAPVGIALSAAIMFIGAMRDAYLWNEHTNQLKTAIKNRDNAIAINNVTAKLEATQKIHYFENEIGINKRNFVYNVGSCVGTTFLAIAAFAVMGAIAANPFTLVVIGISILGAAVAIGAYNTYKKHTATPATVTQIPKKTDTDNTAPTPEEKEPLLPTNNLAHTDGGPRVLRAMKNADIVTHTEKDDDFVVVNLNDLTETTAPSRAASPLSVMELPTLSRSSTAEQTTTEPTPSSPRNNIGR